MKIFIRSVVSLLLVSVQTSMGQRSLAPDYTILRRSEVSLPFRVLDANRIKIALNNSGSLNRDISAFVSQRPDAWYSFDSTYQGILYDQGPWIIGKVNGQLGGGVSIWGSSYAPGPIIDGKPGGWMRPADQWRYHPYKITTGQNPHDSDYVLWPSDLGAPINEDGTPKVLGNQSVWCVYNTADSTVLPYSWRNAQFVRPIVEVQQTAFVRSGGYADTSVFSNAVFFEWTFVNKGPVSIDSCYLAFWTDIDFGKLLTNVPGVDTILQTGYCWWSDTSTTDPDQFAVGHVFLYGPVVPDVKGESIFKGRKRPGFRNLPLSSFWGITEEYPVDTIFVQIPTSIERAWSYARGLDRKGQPITNPRTGERTHFPYSGDPVTRSGWYFDYTRYRGNEAGCMLFSGPFTFAPADTQWMMLALLPATTNDFRKSLHALRSWAGSLRSLPYDSLAKPAPYTPYHPYIPAQTSLYQNYPNPFNSTTTITYEISEPALVQLQIYDILGRHIDNLVRSEQPAGAYTVRMKADNLASGSYFVRLRAGKSTITRKLMIIR